MATITAAVAKGGSRLMFSGGIRRWRGGSPFRIQMSSGWLELEGGEDSGTSGCVWISVLIPGGDRALFLTSVIGGWGKGTGTRDKKISHIYGAPTMNQASHDKTAMIRQGKLKCREAKTRVGSHTARKWQS